MFFLSLFLYFFLSFTKTLLLNVAGSRTIFLQMDSIPWFCPWTATFPSLYRNLWKRQSHNFEWSGSCAAGPLKSQSDVFSYWNWNRLSYRHIQKHCMIVNSQITRLTSQGSLNSNSEEALLQLLHDSPHTVGGNVWKCVMRLFIITPNCNMNERKRDTGRQHFHPQNGLGGINRGHWRAVNLVS